MSVETEEILDVLHRRGVGPYNEVPEHSLVPENEHRDWPDIGTIEDGEQVYTTSLEQVLEARPERTGEPPREFWHLVRRIDEMLRRVGESGYDRRGIPEPPPETPGTAVEPYCAWYCPIHFFGYGWGIYMRESCLYKICGLIAGRLDPGALAQSNLPPDEIVKQLLRSAFYVLFLHEQFHHKVESLGFRLLVASNVDKYRAYKNQVYCATFGTSDCIEESLANAESYRRLTEARYQKKIDPVVRAAVKSYLKASFPHQAPGYREATNFLGDAEFREGLFTIESRVQHGSVHLQLPKEDWAIAPSMIRCLKDISDEIYMIVPQGSAPSFPIASVAPGPSISSDKLISSLETHYGYKRTHGGKGSHVKLKKPGNPTLHVPGNREAVSPGVVKEVLNVLGHYPLSAVPDLIAGRLVHRLRPARRSFEE